MSEAKTYLQAELSEKIPQKIISHFQMTKNIGKNEQVLAVMGATQFMGITSSVVSTRDRLVYLNNSGIAPKLFLIHYADIESVALNPEKNKEYITVTKKNGDTIKLSIDAAVDDTKKFFDFLVGYKDQGAKEPISDFEKSTSNNKVEDKKAQREKEYQEKLAESQREVEKIKQEMTPEAKAKRIQDFNEKQDAKLQKTKEQLAEAQKEIEKNKQELTPEAKAKRAKEINKKIDEEQRQSRLKTAKEYEKVSAELDATTIKRNRAGFNLDYCSGLGGSA